MKRPARRLLGALLALLLLLSLSPAASARLRSPTEIPLPNGDFEQGDLTGWTLSGFSGGVLADSYDASNSTNALNIWASNSAAAEISIRYAVSLEPGSYVFSFAISGMEGASGLVPAAECGGTALVSGQSLTTAGWAVWETVTLETFTLEQAAEISFVLSGTLPAGYWAHLDDLSLVRVDAGSGEPETLPEIPIPNGGFEDGTANWSLSGLPGTVKSNDYSATHTGQVLDLWVSDSEAAAISAAYAVRLTAGEYSFSFDLDGMAGDSGLCWAVTAGEQTLCAGAETLVTAGWDVWQTVSTERFTLTEPTEVRFVLSGTEPAGYWGDLDALRLFGSGGLYTEVTLDHQPTLAVERVNGVEGDGFLRGADVSSFLAIYNSGAQFRDYEGNVLTPQGFFELLAGAGFNYIRLRVWNDPYDAQGRGYGGGNNDLATALQLGRWATAAGMKVLIDFHYSDFWADPGKQYAPKAWAGYTVAQKAAAIDAFTYASLETLLDGGVDVGMVQIGNETNGGICGVTSWSDMASLFSAGSAAVRRISAEREKEILVALHFTNPETAGRYAGLAQKLANSGVDYDVFASSWYPYWHGSPENLTSVLKQVADTYGKQVMIAETSWAWTLDDGDGNANTISGGSYDYPFSQQGQADELVAAAKAIRAVGDAGLGVFYWENAWIPVEYAYSADGSLNEEILASNRVKWESFGSGWASSYGGSYQQDAADWYGGAVVDNQAMFDFHGQALDSLYTWQYMMVGTEDAVEKQVTGVAAVAVETEQGRAPVMPQTVRVTYNVGGSRDEPVVWDAAALAAVDLNTPGVYTVPGVVSLSFELGELSVSAAVTVLRPNLILNPSFEDADLSMYCIHSGGSRTGDDPHSGSWSFHFWNANGVSLELAQDLALQPGVYRYSLWVQGDAMGSTEMASYVELNGERLEAPFALSGWKNWAVPVIEFTLTEAATVRVGLSLVAGPGGWGTIDDLSLVMTDALPAPPTPFVDVPAESWYCEAVQWALDEGITDGISADRFGPELKLTRAQAVTMLWRQAGSPPAQRSAGFADVRAGKWYSAAVGWAAEQGIVTGTSATSFSPKREITRQELVTMLFRYACLLDGSLSVPDTDLSGFEDAAQIAAYALPAMRWAVGNGIMNGVTETSLSPKGSATRAQFVVLLYRWLG